MRTADGDSQRAMELSISRYSEVVERSGPLAELPPSTRELLTLTRSETASVREITSLCEEDLVLAARLLAVVNSRILGCRKPVRSLLRAVVILGVDRLRNLALVSHLTDRLRCLEETFPLKRYWRHAFTVAGIARAVVPEETCSASEDFYTAGMLHDMGVAFFWRLLPDGYPDLFARAAREDIPLQRLERDAMGIDHAELGWRIASAWPISDSVAAALRWHHADTPPESFSEGERMTWEALIAADCASRHSGCGLTEGSIPLAHDMSLPGWIRGGRRRLVDVASRCAREARELQTFLDALPGPLLSSW